MPDPPNTPQLTCPTYTLRTPFSHTPGKRGQVSRNVGSFATFSRSVGKRVWGLEGGGVDHEAVAHVAIDHAFPGFVDLIGVDEFDI